MVAILVVINQLLIQVAYHLSTFPPASSLPGPKVVVPLEDSGDAIPAPTHPANETSPTILLAKLSSSTDTSYDSRLERQISGRGAQRDNLMVKSGLGIVVVLPSRMEGEASSLCNMLAAAAAWDLEPAISVTFFYFDQDVALMAKDALSRCEQQFSIAPIFSAADRSLWGCPSMNFAMEITSTCNFISALENSPYASTLWLNFTSGECAPLITDLITMSTGTMTIPRSADEIILAIPEHAIATTSSIRLDLAHLDYFFAQTGSKSVRNWLWSFKDIYLRHSTQSVFPLLDPYFAFEVALMNHRQVKLHQFQKPQKCPTCAIVSCACPRCEENDYILQGNLRRLVRGLSKTLQGYRLPSLTMSTSMLKTMISSVWRLCPSKRGCRDHWPDSWFNAFDDHKAAKTQFESRRYRVAVVTGSSISMLENMNTRLMLANKQAYSKAHGYGFELGISDFMVARENLAPTVSSHQKFRGEFIKTLMVFNAMKRNPDVDWFVLADHDVWFHPLAMRDTSLDMFFDSVPADKHFVHANYHSMNTGIVLIRNSAKARELVMKWWAIGSSGRIECHSWDQAAAQLLLLHQLDGERSAAPYNFTCVIPNCGNYQRKKYWSCDKGFGDALVAAFSNDTAARYYQRGLLHPDPQVTGHPKTDFHVLSESPLLPRLQCMDCTNITRLTRSGSNYIVNYRGVDGWFAAHKAFSLFRKLFFSPPHTESHTTIHLDRLEIFETGLFAAPSDEREGIKPSN